MRLGGECRYTEREGLPPVISYVGDGEGQVVHDQAHLAGHLGSVAVVVVCPGLFPLRSM